MIKKYSVLYLCVIIILTSCTKDKPDNQTLDPLHMQFLPLYPNSYWYYENELGLIDTFYTKDYEIVKAICYGPPSDAVDSFKTTTLYRGPRLPDLKYIYGYTTYECSSPYSFTSYEIVLSEDVNDSWSVDRKDSRIYSTGISKTTISNSENELKVKEFETALQMGAYVNDTVIYVETYLRDIGLTKRIRINNYTHDSTTVLNLIDYNINN